MHAVATNAAHLGGTLEPTAYWEWCNSDMCRIKIHRAGMRKKPNGIFPAFLSPAQHWVPKQSSRFTARSYPQQRSSFCSWYAWVWSLGERKALAIRADAKLYNSCVPWPPGYIHSWPQLTKSCMCPLRLQCPLYLRGSLQLPPVTTGLASCEVRGWEWVMETVPCSILSWIILDFYGQGICTVLRMMYLRSCLILVLLQAESQGCFDGM